MKGKNIIIIAYSLLKNTELLKQEHALMELWRDHVLKEETSSTTAYLESIMLISVIDSREDRDVVTIDIPNLFIQTLIDRKPGEDKIMMKVKVVLLNMMVQMYP